MKIRTKIFVFIMLLIAISIIAITSVSTGVLLREVKKQKMLDVANVAKDRHHLLASYLNYVHQDTKNLLARIMTVCSSGKENIILNETCVIERLKFQMAQIGANGLIFRKKNNLNQLVVGSFSNLSINEKDFDNNKLAVFKKRGAEDLPRPFYTRAADKELGLELYVEYPLDEIQKIFRPHNDLGNSGETFLADDNGFFITEQRYHSHHNTRQGTLQGIYADPMKSCLANFNGQVLALDYREEPIIHGFRYVPEIGGGCIMAHIEQLEAFAPSRLMTNNIFYFSFVLFLICVPVIFLFANNITRPLVYLSGIVESVTKGDEELESQLRRKDEIGILSNKFNEMLLSIKENKLALEMHQQTIFESSKLNALGEMARGVAHEINSPLAAVLLGGELLEYKNSKLSEPNLDVSKFTKTILDAAHRIEVIIKGLKGFSRDANEDQHDTFTVNQLINTSLNLCAEMLKANKVDLIVQTENLETKIHGKEILLSQCLFNLITNSFEAVSALEVKWIRLDVTIVDHMVELRITDSGTGISIDLQKKIFRPMFTTKAIGSGPGLGLSISRSIISNFGGNILYDDKSEHTCFIMKIPYSFKEVIV
jgi:signal transduction histidine kinase